jgi:hypothetical protein
MSIPVWPDSRSCRAPRFGCVRGVRGVRRMNLRGDCDVDRYSVVVVNTDCTRVHVADMRSCSGVRDSEAATQQLRSVWQ